jgi:hypothetical protein
VALTPKMLEMVQRSPLGATLGRERLHFNMETAVARYLGISVNPANGAVGDFAEGGSS